MLNVVGHTVLFAVDDYLLPFKRNLCYYLTKPEVHTEPVLAPSDDNPNAPDHSVAHFYGTVLHDNNKFKMWYSGKSEADGNGLVCYAESQNGIFWTKPDLNQVEFKGTRKNNIVNLPGQEIYGVSVIKDENDLDPGRRYKMIYEHRDENGRVARRFGKRRLSIRTATSPDGIDWKASDDFAIDDQCEHGSFYQHQGLYVCHGHGTSYGEGGNKQGRQGLTWVSPDFDNWVQGFASGFLMPEPNNRGTQEEYDQVHLGVGAANFGNVCVGVYAIWNNKGWGEEGTSADFGLVISNDGVNFREVVKGYTFLDHEDSPATPVEGFDFPTILCQGNGILNVGEKTLIYHGRWRNAGTIKQTSTSKFYRAETALATLPRDRWGALGLVPEMSNGWVWSEPIIFQNDKIEISLNIDDAKNISVELSDEQFNLLPEYSGANSGFCLDSEGLECKVVWPRGNLESFVNRPIRLRVNLKRIDGNNPLLYAVYLK